MATTNGHAVNGTHVNGASTSTSTHNGTAKAGKQLKGPGLDHMKLISKSALRRPESPIRSLFPAEALPGMLSFLAGKPNAATFPIDEITIKLKPGQERGGGELVANGSATNGQASAPRKELAITGKELDMALQYGSTPGLAPLVQWLMQWQSHLHQRPIVRPGDAVIGGRNPWALHVGHGSQDFLTKVFNTLLDAGDSCLVERPVYAGVMPNLVTLEAEVVAVESDEQGMSPESLEGILASWGTAEATRRLDFPKFVLTTPTGANPSGTTASEDRKREVLRIVRKYGLLLIEDDPYALLAFEGLDEGPPETRRRLRTYWSIEQDDAEEWGTGWVLRLDSFSKVLSAGIRMGYLTGSPTILKYVETETAVANLQPSGVAQIVTYKLLQNWGIDGLLRHGDAVAKFYRQRRDNFEGTARAILGADESKGQRSVADWVTPVAGMFLWLRLKLPPNDASDIGDSYALVREKAKAKGVLAVPGMSFMPDNRTTCYVRTSFSIIEESDVPEAFKRLRSVIEDAWADAGVELPA